MRDPAAQVETDEFAAVEAEAKRLDEACRNADIRSDEARYRLGTLLARIRSRGLHRLAWEPWVATTLRDPDGQPRTVKWANDLIDKVKAVARHPSLEAELNRAWQAGQPAASLSACVIAVRRAERDGWDESRTVAEAKRGTTALRAEQIPWTRPPVPPDLRDRWLAETVPVACRLQDLDASVITETAGFEAVVESLSDLRDALEAVLQAGNAGPLDALIRAYRASEEPH